MKTVLKNVYYCDFCGKRGLSASHMKKHERVCTANPKRVCGKCNGRDIEGMVSELVKRFDIVDKYDMGQSEYTVKWNGEPVTLDEVRKLSDGCPNCMLAIMRQTKLNYKCCGLQSFDYKKEFSDYGIQNDEINKRFVKEYGNTYDWE